MEIFKDKLTHSRISADLKHVHAAFRECQTRLAENALTDVIDALDQEMSCNLTEEAAVKMEALCDQHPDSSVEGMIDFLVFKNSAKVESAKDFNTRMAKEVVDENLTSQVRVYSDDFFIEVDYSGKHSMTVENRTWSEPETPLEAMELELFEFSRAMGG